MTSDALLSIYKLVSLVAGETLSKISAGLTITLTLSTRPIDIDKSLLALDTLTHIVGTRSRDTIRVITSKDAGIVLEDLIRATTKAYVLLDTCLLYTSPSPRDLSTSRMPSSA